MASNEHSEDSLKSSITDTVVDAIVPKSKIEERASSIALSVDEHNEPDIAVNAEEKKNLTADVTNESLDTEKKDADSTESHNAEDLKLLAIDKNEQDSSKADNKQDIVKEIEQEIQDASILSHPQNERKDSNNENSKDSLLSLQKGGYALKRKRKTPNYLEVIKRGMNRSSTPKVDSPVDSPVEESGTRSKRKKLKAVNDRFCWRCHKESVDVHCTACPRSWHRKCIGGAPSSLQKWICGECASILKAENAETRSMAMAQLSVDQLCMLLKHVVERLRGYPGAEPFYKPVDLAEVSNYLDYVIKPMDLSLLESNVRAKLYGSTDAFMADAKWIQHNCIVFNTCGGVYADTSKLTNAAKQLIKVARQEVSEIEACPDCYAHGRNLPRPQPSWFIEPCRRPHPLVWAKLKGWPFWPAKAMPRLNSQGYVDVRFFGQHDRAWIAPKDLFLYSEEPPAPSPRKRKFDMDECVREITRHCRKLELMFGQFKFAPPKVQYNPNDPMQITILLPKYNPYEPNSHLTNSESSVSKKKMPLRKRSIPMKDKSQNDDSITDNGGANASLKGNVNSNNHEKESDAVPTKVQKLDSDDIKNTSNSQNNLSGNHSKLNKRESQEVVITAQIKVVKDGAKSAKRSSIKDSDVKSNTSSPNTSNKTNSLKKAKDEVKSVVESLSKLVTSPSVREQSDSARAQKRNLSKSIVSPKRDVSQNTSDNPAKSTPKYAKYGGGKVYKPKTRMVDKLNAEKALKAISASKENDKLTTPNASSPTHNRGVSLLNSSAKESANAKKIQEIDITLSPVPSSAKALNKTTEAHPALSTKNPHDPTAHSADKSVLYVVMNNGTTAEAAKQQQATTMIADYRGNKSAPAVGVQREAKEAPDNPFQKKESKAKKSFPNKARGGTQADQRSLPTNVAGEPPIPSSKSDTSSGYQLLPPEAGPISARLHHSAQELARRMGQLMEEAYKEAAQADGNGENGTADSYQATIFFLRMQIEHMKWQHQQQIAELKHNADRTMREMRASLEAEKLRSMEETRREAEEEKARCIEETKQKQWCARCGKEALFYCCWNTAYCDYSCQQTHWPVHMRTCSQQPAYTTIVTTSSTSNANSQPQSMPRLVFNATSDAWRT